MTAGPLIPEALRLPAAPLLAAVDQAAHDRRTSVSDLLGNSGQKAYARARAAGTATLAQVEAVCDRLGCHPYELYGPAYQRLALASGSGPLEPEVTVTAWHQAACARPGCHQPDPARRAGRAGRRRRPVLRRLLRPRPPPDPARRGDPRGHRRAGQEGAGRMTDRSAIEWTQATWNPVTGCDRISPGCQHCYALTLAKRLKAMGQAKYQTDGRPPTSGPGFGVAAHPHAQRAAALAAAPA